MVNAMASVQASGNHAFDILDGNGWLEVFERVDHPQDLYSLSNTCIGFQKLLDRSKWKWGISLILPHIAPHFSIKRTSDDGISHFILISKMISDHDWKGLLKLRLISKDWCKAIDDFLSSPTSLKKLNRDWKHYLIHDFGSVEDIESFQEAFQGWNKNPFPSRTLAFSSLRFNFIELHLNQLLDADLEQLRSTYIAKISELIEDFGEHIHTLILSPDSVSGNCRQRYETIRNYLVNLPNIEILTLPAYLHGFLEIENEEVANYLAENPLPPLPHLEDFDFNPHCVELYHFILAHYAPQLKRVWSLLLNDAPSRALIADMTRLEYLALSLDPNDLNFEHLSQLQSPSLQTLDIVLINQEAPKIFHIDKFLQSVRHLPLKALRVKVCIGTVIIQESGLPLDDFRNETIQFFSFKSITASLTVSFNFLEALTKAEEIELSHDSFDAFFVPGDNTPTRQHPHQVPETIQLYRFFYGEGFEGDPYTKMYQSNIWELIPSLKTLSITGSHTDELPPNFQGVDVERILNLDLELLIGFVRKKRMSFKARYSRNVYDKLKN